MKKHFYSILLVVFLFAGIIINILQITFKENWRHNMQKNEFIRPSLNSIPENYNGLFVLKDQNGQSIAEVHLTEGRLGSYIKGYYSNGEVRHITNIDLSSNQKQVKVFDMMGNRVIMLQCNYVAR
ncbi:MAG: hypothetical protein ACEPOW_05265 [Bacteroidales bacterium]